MHVAAITDRDFEQIRALAFRRAGISMAPSKKTLVESRLRKRLLALGVPSYGEYFELISRIDAKDELQTAIDLLTTNETSFFREPKHFRHLQTYAASKRPLRNRFRAWSAACSSGEEPYTIAMVLANVFGTGDWQVAASDLSTHVLRKARSAHYSLDRARSIPVEYLRRYCLRGTGEQSGTFLIDAPLRSRVQFSHANLLEPPARDFGPFDVIFLRNVMIYFELKTKQRVLQNLLPALRPGGFFYIGHSETLNGVTTELEAVAPSIYRKS